MSTVATTPRRRATKPSPTVAKFAHCKRGEVVQVTPNTTGKFVGITTGGTAWFAYAGQDFDAMCRNFDANFANRR